MTEQQRKLQSAEAFVRKVLSNDFKQQPSAALVKRVAEKVAKAVPSLTDSHRRSA